MKSEESAYINIIEDVRITIKTGKINIDTGDVLIYSNYLIISPKNEDKKYKLVYDDIIFSAIELTKRVIILSDLKKYDVINIFIGEDKNIFELFEEIRTCMHNSDIKENVELNEDENNEKLLTEWEEKMVFNDLDEKEKTK